MKQVRGIRFTLMKAFGAGIDAEQIVQAYEAWRIATRARPATIAKRGNDWAG